MAKGHSHKHSHKHKHKHGHGHGKHPDNGKSGEPQAKPAAPEASPVNPALFQWSQPIPNPDGGPFSWRVRLTPRGSYIPVVVSECVTNDQSRSPGFWEWQILGSEVISSARPLAHEMQPYTTSLAQPSAPPYGLYDSRTNMLQPMPVVAHPQYQYQVWAGSTNPAALYNPNPQGVHKATGNESIPVDTSGTHKGGNIVQEKAPNQRGSSSHKDPKLTRHNRRPE